MMSTYERNWMAAFMLTLLIVLTTPPAAAQSTFSDGVLDNRDLQAVVEAQQNRDAATLEAFLRDDASRIRARAAYSAGSVRDSSLIPALLPLLADTSPVVRANAAFALGQQPASVPIADLQHRLDAEDDPNALAELFGALGKKASHTHLPAILGADVPTEMQPRRLLAIAQIGLQDSLSNAAVGYLIQHLGSEDEKTQEYAAYYFGRAPSPNTWRDRADALRGALTAMNRAHPASFHLIQAIARLEDEDDLPLFERFLSAEADWRAQVEAIRAIGAHAESDRAPLGALLDMLGAENGLVRLEAAQSLSAAAPWPEDIHHAVRDRLQRETLHWTAESPLVAGLAAGGDEEMLWSRLEQWNYNPPAHAAGLSALQEIDQEEAISYLLDTLESDDPPVVAAALNQLSAPRFAGNLSDETIQTILSNADRHLSEVQPIVAYAFTSFLEAAELDEETNAALLSRLYQNLDNDHVGVRVHLLNYAGETGLSQARGFANEALANEHPLVQEAAADAIEDLSGERPHYEPAAAEYRTNIDWNYLRSLGDQPALQFETERGTFTVTLLPVEAPLTVQSLTELANDGAYDGVPFHRVIANFVAQGGDVAGDHGYGGPGYTIRSEFTRLGYETGTAGMASSGYDTEGSQFFFTHSMQPHLNGNYTAFGYVSEGQDIIDTILPYDQVIEARVVSN